MALGGGRFRVDNTPWFVAGIAADDVVRAVQESDGTWWITEVIEWGGRLAIRVIPFRDGPLHGSLQAVVDAFAPLGVRAEGAAPAYPIVALNIGPEVDVAAVKALLVAGEADGRWSYDEGCISDEWADLRV